MKIGILVDGQAEFHSFPLVIPKIRTDNTVINPLYCDMQPFSTPEQIAHVAASRAAILLGRGGSLIVIVLDKEARPDCTPDVAARIQRAFASRLAAEDRSIAASVVVKDSTFENWLVADPAVDSRS